MKPLHRVLPLLGGFLTFAVSGAAWLFAADEPPTDWIEPATGHRVIRLSSEPGTSSLYFHQQAYTDKGDKLFVTLFTGPAGGRRGQPGPDAIRGGSMGTIDLTTLGVSPTKYEKIADTFARGAVVGKKTRTVYYIRSEMVEARRVDKVFGTQLDTHETREIATLPTSGRGGAGLAINADETLLAGSLVDGVAPADTTPQQRPAETERAAQEGVQQRPNPTEENRATQERSLEQRWRSRQPRRLYTVDIRSGQVQTFHPSTDWLNHIQFSTTDPTLIMFCHEGPWHFVDRIWTIRTDGSGVRLMHPRTMPNEIAGHEFFGHDGKWIWYDLQTPRSQEFWLAGVNVETGERLRYPVERQNWSVHFNQSHDGKLFAGDGGGPFSVANRTPLPDNQPLSPPGNGQWIYLFTPKNVSAASIKVGDETVNIGKFEVEKLVDLSKHNYNLEPNLTFTPDNKWLVFRSNMHGPTHTYAVEVRKSQ